MSTEETEEEFEIELPPGLTDEQFEWLKALGEAASEVEQENLLRQAPGWNTCEFAARAIQAFTVINMVPAQARVWLPAIRGLVALSDRLSIPSLQGQARLIGVDIASRSNSPQEAFLFAEKAHTLFRELQDRENLAKSYLGLGRAYCELSRVAEGMAMYERAQEIFRELGDRLNLAHCYMEIGRCYFVSARLTDAMVMCEKARAIYSDLDNKEGLIRSHIGLGAIFYYTGRPRDNEARLNHLCTLCEEIGDWKSLGFCYGGYGNLYLATGHKAEAIEMYLKACRIFEKIDEQIICGICYSNAGEVYSEMGEFEQALALYQKTEQIGEQIDNQVMIALSCLNQGRTYAAMGRLDDAFAKLNRARRLYEDRDDSRYLVYCYQAYGSIYQSSSHPEKAIEAYEQALNRMQILRESFSEPELSAGTISDFETLLAALAVLYVQSGRTEEAFDATQRGRSAPFRWARSDSPVITESLSDEEKQRRAQLQSNYEIAQRQLNQASPNSIEYPQLLQARDRAFIELDNYETILHSEYPQWYQVQTAPPALQEIAQLIDTQTATLELLIDRHSLCLMVCRKHEERLVLHAKLVSIEREQLEKWVTAYLKGLRRQGGTGLQERTKEIKGLSRRLYDYLIKPIEKHLKGITTLVICPEQFLHQVPFESLQDNKKHYLIENFALSIASSTSAWLTCREVALQRKQQEKGLPLLTALSRFLDRSPLVLNLAPESARGAGGLHELPHVRDEVQVVSRAFEGNLNLLTESEATAEAVLQAAPDASLLHFATHAFPNAAAPLMSALAIAPHNEEDLGLLYARDIYSMRLKAGLTVLSACSTAEGRIAGGEGLLGLAWAFLIAGCPSTVATRWQVQDEAACLWVETFYRHYTAGESKAESCRQACLRLLRTHEEAKDFSSPACWACWMLMGDNG